MKAWLEGDGIDLRALTRLLSDGDVRVLHNADDDAYYLTAPEIDTPSPTDNPSETGQFDKAAEALLRRINGVARVRDPSYRPVKLSGRYTDRDGTDKHVADITLELRLELSMTTVLTGPDGKQKPHPPSPWPGWLALAEARPEVAEVLGIMSQNEPLGWVELYKIHEIIRDSIKPQKSPDLGWADKPTDSAFTGSANLPAVSGSGARHARMEGNPKRTMKIDQGRRYISDLVAKWLDWVAGNSLGT